jgi:hypothetical protein
MKKLIRLIVCKIINSNTRKLLDRIFLTIDHHEDKINLLDSKNIFYEIGDCISVGIVDFINKIVIENDIDTIDKLINENMLSVRCNYVLCFCLICRFGDLNLIKYFFGKNKKQLVIGYQNRLFNYESPAGPYTIVSERVDDNVEIVDFIINSTDNFGSFTYYLACSLRSAAQCGNFKTFQYLYSKSVSLSNVFTKNTFLYFFWENSIVEVLEYLIVNQYSKKDDVMEMISSVSFESKICDLIMELISSGHLNFTEDQLKLIEQKFTHL